MSDTVNVANSATSSVENTSNPQAGGQSISQSALNGSLQSSNGSSSLNNSPRGGNTVTINNFSLNDLTLSGSSSGTIAPLNQSVTSQGISPWAIGIVAAFIIAAIVAFYLAKKTNKITTKKA